MFKQRVISILLALSAAASSVYAAMPGDLDTSFGGGDGWVSTDVSAGPDEAKAVIQQTDGKLVVAGFTRTASRDIALVRYNADGSLDTDFGGDGIVTTKLRSYTDEATSIIQQTDGKLVVGGYTGGISDLDFAIVRYNEDGSLDASFDNDGMASTPISPGIDVAYDLIQQADGMLVLVGWCGSCPNSDLAIVRYESDGSLDANFSGDGIMTEGFSNYDDIAYSLVQVKTGELVVVGSSQADRFIARYKSDGTLDTSFSDDGKIIEAFGDGEDHASAVIEQQDGKLLVLGKTNNIGDGVFNLAISRYSSDGVLDAAFGSQGKMKFDFGGNDEAAGLIQQQDGRIVVTGTMRPQDQDSQFLVARLFEDHIDTYVTGKKRLDKAGTSVAFAGDFNGDGSGDYVYGVPGHDQSIAIGVILKNAGRAEVVSGKGGNVLAELNGDAAKNALGRSVAGAADIDADGFDDVVVGAPWADNVELGLKDAGSITILFGPDGKRSQIIFGDTANALYGSSLALGDVDGDGLPDILVGSPRDDHPAASLVDAGSVSVISGDGFQESSVYYGATAKAYAGTSVAAGDVDGDGKADVLIGAPGEAGYGRVTAFNLTGAELLKKTGATLAARFGDSLAAADMDKDGHADVLVGAPADDDMIELLKDSGSVTLFSGANGTQLTKKYGSHAKSYLGSSVATADIDADGYADLIGGAPGYEDGSKPRLLRDAGGLFVWGGNGYGFIAVKVGPAKRDYFGSAIGAGDINADGHGDLIIGIPGFDAVSPNKIKDSGAVQVVSGAALAHSP